MTSSKPGALERYYQMHSRIYDLTRWSFLFGRTALIQRLSPQNINRILEVGCGTGKNLIHLCHKYPAAQIHGLDLSAAMLLVAQKNLGPLGDRIKLLHQPYCRPPGAQPPYDLLLFSYTLSMVNPGWDKAIDSAYGDLAAGGYLAVVDFHRSPHAGFKRWMEINHVCLGGHLLPRLQITFPVNFYTIHRAYFGLWSYFLFFGKKN